MADAAALRREARRRRILENSQNRLQLISGKTEEVPIESPSAQLSHSHEEEPLITEEPIQTSIFSNGILNPDDAFGLLSQITDTIAAGDTEVLNARPAIAPPATEPAPEPTTIHKITSHKYDIVLLSLLMQVVCSLPVIPYNINDNYFFLPLIVYVVTKTIWFPTESKSNLASMLLLLNGISAAKASKIMYFVQLVGTLSQDVCIYLFTTICVQSLYITIKDCLIT